MKKLFLFFLLACISSVFFGTAALAANASNTSNASVEAPKVVAKIDSTNSAKGILTVTLTNFEGKVIKAQVEKGTEKYLYTLTKSSVNLPLQMGTGEYKITVLEGVDGNKYKSIASETIKVEAIDEKELYKASIPMVEYGVSKTAIPAFKTLVEKKTSDSDKIKTIYDEVVKNYSYDTDKAATVKSDYVPVIDTIYSAKKGICYDYAAIVGGALRSQGIPTKLVMGYVPEIEEYHAWNEILVDGKWIAVDATYDAQIVKAGKKYEMEKDISKTKILKTY